MSTVNQVIRELQGRRNRAEREIDRLDLAIKALEQINGMSEVTAAAPGRRTMSAAARRRIAMAMKARWAKRKGMARPGSKKTPSCHPKGGPESLPQRKRVGQGTAHRSSNVPLNQTDRQQIVTGRDVRQVVDIAPFWRSARTV